MSNALRKTSTLTAKGQTTVPEVVRQALGVTAGDKIAFDIKDGAVTVSRVEEEHTDPTLVAFLDFLDRDMAQPGRIQPLSEDFLREIDEALGPMDPDLDLDAPIDGDSSL